MKAKKNPLVGKEVWTLVITNDYDNGVTTCGVYTSLQKAINAAKVEFRVYGNMEYWDEAKKELRSHLFYRNERLFNGDSFIIDVTKIA